MTSEDVENCNIVVVGRRGMLGREVVESLKNAGLTVAALDSTVIDITKRESVHSVLSRISCSAPPDKLRGLYRRR